MALANYNHGHCVSRAIEAILGQSRPPDDFIIVDDGSTDDSVAIFERYARRYPFIRLVRNERNEGLLFTIRKLLELASADFIYFASSDDYVLPGWFEEAMAMAERYPEAGLLFAWQMVEWENGEQVLQDRLPSWSEPTFATPRRFLDEYLRKAAALHSNTSTFIFRRSCFLEVGGLIPEIAYWSDTFAARAIALKHGVCFVPRPGAVFAFNPQGFCARHVRDLDRAFPPIEAALARMRSPAFADRFPADYVDEWWREVQKDVINFHCWLKYSVPSNARLRQARARLAPLGVLGPALAHLQTLPRRGLADCQRRLAQRLLLWSHASSRRTA